MKRLSNVILSAGMSIALLFGASMILTGCAADTLSGPSIEAYAGGDGADGSDHNNGVANGDGADGSDHNNGKDNGDGADGSDHNNGKTGGDGADGSDHNNG